MGWKYLVYGKLSKLIIQQMNKFTIEWTNGWMNEKLIPQRCAPFLSCGILHILAPCWVHRPKKNTVLWTWRERAALLVSFLLMEKEEFSESQNASQSQKKQDFQIVFSLGFHNSLWVQITKNQVHDHCHHGYRLPTKQKEQSSHPCKNTHVQSLSSSVSNSEGDPFMVSAPLSFLASSPSPALNQLPFRSLSRKLHLPDWLSPCTQHPLDGLSFQAYMFKKSLYADHWHIVK